MVKFEKVNNNVKGRKTGDCVIRATANATGQTWVEALREQTEIAIKTGYMVACKENYDRYLSAHGFVKMKQPRKWDGKKYTVGEMDNVCHCNNDVIVVSMANHLTVIKDGAVEDLWDCRHKTVGNYWIKMR